MDINGIGYSNIRLPSNSSSYLYTYDPLINIFPEEVFVHEFLHTLERIMNERKYSIPELHDNKKYGYESERLIGLKDWYYDYMNCNIHTNDGQLIGLDESVYSDTPPAKSDFKYSIEINFNNESNSIIDVIKSIFRSTVNFFKAKT